VRNPSIEAAPLQQELMLFNAATKNFCVLNATAAHVWASLEEPRTAEELVNSLCAQFDTNSSETVAEDVAAVLGQLESLELVSRQSS
jgi:PqqD family protein of HPr-rel-A system